MVAQLLLLVLAGIVLAILEERRRVAADLDAEAGEVPAGPYDQAQEQETACACGRLHEPWLMPVELLLAGGVDVSVRRWRG